MRKFLILMLSIFLFFSLASCGKEENNNEPQNEDPIVEPENEDFLDYEGVIYNTNNFTEVDSANLEGDYNLAKNIQEGVILHAWNWSYQEIENNLEAIAKAGFSTVQTSPVQPPKEYNENLTDVADRWWKLYQPLGFSVADKSWLGTAKELKSLCEKAKEYGIKIIVDIVFNHLAGGTATSFNPEVKNYEPEIYEQNLIHMQGTSGGEINGAMGDFPDLMTENELVQQRALSLLKECIDLGVSGFRFDAAKHVGTQTDGSNFWPFVLNGATSYANENYNFTPYYYGEILNDLTGGRKMKTYTDMMSVTDNGASANIYQKMSSANVLYGLDYAKTDDPTKIVLWVESHDTYTENVELGNNNPSDAKIRRAWSIVANRYGATALFFARPAFDKATQTYISQMGEMGSTGFLDPVVVQTNKFHNLFIGAKEIATYQNSCLVMERYREADNKRGVIITNANGKNDAYLRDINVGLKDGLYIDQISGNRFLVENGKLRGQLENGVAVLYETERTVVQNKPLIFTTVSSTKFYSDQEIKVTITITSDAKEVYYSIDGGAEAKLSGTTIEVNKECSIKLTAKGESETVKTININNIDNTVVKKDGYIAFAGSSENYLNNYDIYAWVWGKGRGGRYESVLIENGIIYVPYEANDYGMLLVVLNKGEKIKDMNAWHEPIITKTADFIFDANLCYDSGLK